MKIHLFIAILFILPVTVVARERDTISDRKLRYGVEIAGFLLPEVKNKNITKNDKNMSSGVNMIINYNINEKIAISSGTGFHTGWYDRRFVYGQYRHIYFNFKLPLMLQYTINGNKNKISYGAKTGVSLDFIRNEYKKNDKRFVYMPPEDKLHDQWAVSFPLAIGIKYHLNNDTKIFIDMNGAMSNYWGFYYGTSLGIIF